MPRSTAPPPPAARARRSRIHGTGLFATRDLAPGERIIEYTGERITKAESDRRYEKQAKDGHIYLYELNGRFDLDGALGGNDSRFANHSCDGNAESDVIRGKVWIVARRAIRKGDEITYDYNMSSVDHRDRPCRCGANACRGYIVGKDVHQYLKRKARKEAERQALIADRVSGAPLAAARDSGIHGTGLFATTLVLKSERIIEYTGDRITKAESERRYQDQAKAGRVYLFDLDETHDIDGSNGGDAKYANHSCDPNAETHIQDGHIWVVASRDIEAGEEITYDYRFPLVDYEDMPCSCGSPKCRGWIIGPDAYRQLRRREARKRGGGRKPEKRWRR